MHARYKKNLVKESSTLNFHCTFSLPRFATWYVKLNTIHFGYVTEKKLIKSVINQGWWGGGEILRSRQK